MKHASTAELRKSIQSAPPTIAPLPDPAAKTFGTQASEPSTLGAERPPDQSFVGPGPSGSKDTNQIPLTESTSEVSSDADHTATAEVASHPGAQPPASPQHASLLKEKNHAGLGGSDVGVTAGPSATPKPTQVNAAQSANAGKSKATDSKTKSPSASPFKDHEPCDEPVNAAELLTEVSVLIRRFIILEPEQADACTLWVAHTHMVEVAANSPILIVNAPERACGKTLVQDVLGRMAHRALHASNASMSALFRAIELWGVTLMIDEADTFFRENSDLHGMVNAGHKRGGTVMRSESKGDNFEPKAFSVYGAKSIAGIALERHLPDATMSRGVVIAMRRKLAHEKVERLRHADPSIFDRLGAQLSRFAADCAGQIERARPPMPDQLSDRAQDNWEPLLAIAMTAGDGWFKRATEAALKLSSASDAQTGAGNDLLADIRDVLRNGSQRTTVPTAELMVGLLADPEMGWNTYNRGKPLTPRQLAKLLDVYGIHPKTVRQSDGSTPKGYVVADFEDAFVRYLKPSIPAEDVDPSRSKFDCEPSLNVAATAQHRSARIAPSPIKGGDDDDAF